MKSETIVTKFDPRALPRWAQRFPEVVALCERNLAYRVAVHNAKTAQMRKFLKRQAR
jgi:hypothetical protein